MQSEKANRFVEQDRALILNNSISSNINPVNNSKSKSGDSIKRNSQNFTRQSEVVDSISMIQSARKSAGENRTTASSKSFMYAAAILNELNKKDPSLVTKFLGYFQDSLIITKQCNLEAIKPAAHQALNKLIQDGSIDLKSVKQITHSAWKLVFKDIQNVNSSSPNNRKSLNELRHVRDLSTTNNSIAKISSLPSGFLWKPISDSPPHGLAILLPSLWSGELKGVDIIDPQDGEILAQGKDGGVGNGDRQHYRFNNQGGDFPEGAIVRVYFKDGTTKDIVIENTSERVEGR